MSSSLPSRYDVLDEKEMRYPKMANYLTRLATFNIPNGGHPFPPPHFIVTKESLALEGFFLLPPSVSSSSSASLINDRCVCFACGCILNKWKEDDIASVEHRKHTANTGGCPLIRHRDAAQYAYDKVKRKVNALYSNDKTDNKTDQHTNNNSNNSKTAATATTTTGNNSINDSSGSVPSSHSSGDDDNLRIINIVYHAAPSCFDHIQREQSKKRIKAFQTQLADHQQQKINNSSNDSIKNEEINNSISGHIEASSSDSKRLLQSLFLQEVMMSLLMDEEQNYNISGKKNEQEKHDNHVDGSDENNEPDGIAA